MKKKLSGGPTHYVDTPTSFDVEMGLDNIEKQESTKCTSLIQF